MNWKRLIPASVVIWVVGSVFAVLTCGWLFNWVYLIEPLIWKDSAEMFTANAMIYSYGAGLVISFLFTLVYAILYKGIPGKGIKKGLAYGFLIWLVSALAGMATLPVYMTIAVTVVVYWILHALVLHLINGLIIGAIYKPK